jgi:hypothetical protein
MIGSGSRGVPFGASDEPSSHRSNLPMGPHDPRHGFASAIMTPKLGRALRGRRKAADDETTSIADEANLWWTRRDFVQHAVVRTSSGKDAPSIDGHTTGDANPADRSTEGSFAMMFPTTSLYEPATVSPPPASPPPPSPQRARVPQHHPLASALHCLGLDREASWADVQHAYRARAKEAHPDRTGDDGEAMAELNATYASLRNGWRYGLFGDD